jgi:molybdate transport system substrate-binding protein
MACSRTTKVKGRLARKLTTVAAALSLFVAACQQKHQYEAVSASEITVAAAANLIYVFEEAARRFTAQTGIRVVYSFGSTAILTKQIENGAPFDVFAAADLAHIDVLDRKGMLAPGSRAIYARGRLVMWMPPHSRAAVDRVEDITGPDIKTVAVAKPDLAPYGKATVEALRALNLWPTVEARIVYAANASQARQFAVSGNADVAFIPLSMIEPGEGRYIEIDQQLHEPIDQALGIVKTSGKQDAARRFVGFVLSAEGQALLQKYGYNKPAAE